MDDRQNEYRKRSLSNELWTTQPGHHVENARFSPNLALEKRPKAKGLTSPKKGRFQNINGPATSKNAPPHLDALRPPQRPPHPKSKLLEQMALIPPHFLLRGFCFGVAEFGHREQCDPCLRHPLTPLSSSPDHPFCEQDIRDESKPRHEPISIHRRRSEGHDDAILPRPERDGR
jgi:hypothetical protein